MNKSFYPQQLIEHGISAKDADLLAQQINYYLKNYLTEEAWEEVSKKVLTTQMPFQLHYFLFTQLFPHWPQEPESGPAWAPPKDFIKTTNLARSMSQLKIHSYREFHAWSTNHYEKFWQHAIKKLNIFFKKDPTKICDISEGIESPYWLAGGELNIAESCFNAPSSKIAILFQNEKGPIQQISYGELNRLSNRVANSLIRKGFMPGDAIAIDMPMTYAAVAIYLGIIKMGGVVVSIADSFSKDEIATRLRISNSKAIFTQDYIFRDAKKLALYEKIIAANAPPAIVLAAENKVTLPMRKEDFEWDNFLLDDDAFDAYPCEPMAHCNILFSSGTTAEPKAIPWNHTTAIKAAVDAYYHQNIQANDILCWPTNLGWMMGPWVIFASFINQATLAIYDGVPRSRAFGKFIQDTKVTMLGVVPTLVAGWRQSKCMEGLNWQSIKVFSSTGECSNPEDMFYLMSLASYKPVIEYCGGTEIGGAYITSTLLEKNYPSVCTTPALGLNFVLLDEEGKPANTGEVAIIPPSMGLSTELLNVNHHQVYFENMPNSPEGKILRRHGDQVRCFANGYYCVLGRADDTMNLGGIKISSAEIERVLNGVPDIIETAAISVTFAEHGPSHLIIFAATKNNNLDKNSIKEIMQKKINLHLNPLFKIEDLVLVTELPKTASNKIMRRVLRKQYQPSK